MSANFRLKSAEYGVRASRSGFFARISFDAGVGSNFSNAARDVKGFPVNYSGSTIIILTKGIV
ncbi:MAG: hypothetical protein H7069_10595 [Phormidesmis sp. FL-bin-119]|nr:hypothetical protein [Pedobacter sp.]